MRCKILNQISQNCIMFKCISFTNYSIKPNLNLNLNLKCGKATDGRWVDIFVVSEL